MFDVLALKETALPDKEEVNVQMQHSSSQPPLQTPSGWRSIRTTKPNKRYAAYNYLLLSYGGEQESYAETQKANSKLEWESTMAENMDSLRRNQT